jgi:site-specific recombinase XerD
MSSTRNNPSQQLEHYPSVSTALSFSEASRLYLDHIRIERGLSKETVYSYASWLTNFTKWAEENGYPAPTLAVFNVHVLTRFLHTLHARNLRPRSIRGVFYPLRGLGDYLVKMEYLTENPAKKITLPKKDAAIRQTVTDSEVSNLLDAATKIRNKKRSALAHAVLSIFIYGGLRRTETIRLHLNDVNTEDGSLLVRAGKGSKSRRVFPHQDCMNAIQEWLAFRPTDLPHDLLFIAGQSRPMGEQALVTLLQEVKCIAGYREERRFCLHALRHNCATRLLRNGADLGQIQVFLGHNSLMTTQMYLHTGEENIRGIGHLTAIKPSEAFQEQNSPSARPQVRGVPTGRARTASNYQQRRLGR